MNRINDRNKKELNPSRILQLRTFPLRPLLSHHHQQLARSNTVPSQHGKSTPFFIGGDDKRKYEKHMAVPFTRDLIEKNGWTAENIIYHCNNQGFRAEQPNSKLYDGEEGGVIYLGDSNVFGIGLNIEQSMTHIAHYNSKLKHLRYINMGQPGSGITTAQRVLRYNIEKLKPQYVIGGFHWAHTRQEFYWPTSEHSDYKVLIVNALHKRDEHFLRLFTPEQGIIRYLASLEAIKWTCQQHGAKLLWIEDEETNSIPLDFQSIDKECKARDLDHWGVRTHQRIGMDLAKVIDAKFGADFD